MRSLCVPPVLHDDVNDAHRAGANRLQNETKQECYVDTGRHTFLPYTFQYVCQSCRLALQVDCP